MPGSVTISTATTVLPLSLCTAFEESREFPGSGNEYRNGEFQGAAEATTSRRRWRLSKRITPTTLATLRTFYGARKGPHQAFYFYYPFSEHDPTGVSATGRYLVRFDSAWQQESYIARIGTNLQLIEIA